MLRILLVSALAASVLPAAAAPQPPAAKTVQIEVSNFKFVPATIALERNRSYVFHFVNEGGGGHTFVARKFFGAANIAPEDRQLMDNGAVDLSGHETLDLHLVAPAPGRYEAHCSHFMHSMFGMTAAIIVG